MNRPVVCIAGVCVVLFAGAGEATLARGATGTVPMRHVVVTLKAQASVSDISGPRATRLREVIHRRQARSESSYASFGARMARWRREGRVTSLTRLWVTNGFAITAAPTVIDALSGDPAVDRIEADVARIVPEASGTAEWNIGQIGAPAVWDQLDTGQGVVVATLDSGVDIDHPDLAGRWRGGNNSWYDPYGQQPTTPPTSQGTAQASWA